MSLTRQVREEVWVAAKLLRKQGKKPKGKTLGAKPEALRTNPLACAAFAGQLMRTHAAVQQAGFVELLEPLCSHMQDLGVEL